MKLLYICHESLPSPHTNTEQLMQTVSGLTRQGCRVDLLIPKQSKASCMGSERQGEIASFYGIDRSVFEGGLNLIELPRAGFIGSRIRRPLHDVRAVMFGRGKRYDLVYTRDPFALLVALAAGVRTVFETYRTDINTLSRYRAWRSTCYSRPHLLGIITHSRLSRQSFLNAGVDASRILVAYNGCSPPSPTPAGKRGAIRRELRLKTDGKMALYAGHINRQKGLDVFVPLAKMLADIQFVLVGGMSGSSESARFEHKIRSQGISNLTLVPRVAPSQVAGYISAADCLIIPPSSEPLTKSRRTVLPLKTFRYLASGRPIVAPDLPDIREVLVHGYNAVLVPPDSPKRAARAIQDLFNDAELRERISENALLDSGKYSWEGRAARISAFLRDLLGEKEPIIATERSS